MNGRKIDALDFPMRKQNEQRVILEDCEESGVLLTLTFQRKSGLISKLSKKSKKRSLIVQFQLIIKAVSMRMKSISGSSPVTMRITTSLNGARHRNI